MAGRWETVMVDGREMQCYVSIPDGSGPFPGLLVAQHAGGVDNFIQTMNDRFAQEGFAAISPDLYHRDDPNETDVMAKMGRLRDDNIVQDMRAALEKLKQLPEVRADRIGTTGFCMGGRVAYLNAVHIPELKACVVYYGGNIMKPWGDGPSPLDLSERIPCPVLGLFGEDDQNPSPADVAKIDGELTRLGKPHEFHMYKGAGHAFMNFERPSFRQEASEDAWKKCIAFFHQHLA